MTTISFQRIVARMSIKSTSLILLAITFTLVLAVEVHSGLQNANAWKNPVRPPVHFNDNGTFKITIFTDLHYGEMEGTGGPTNDIKSTKVMFDILHWEKPDFVVFTGDFVSGQELFPNVTAVMDQLLEPVVKGNYSWASTYGNHDIGNNVTRVKILMAEQRYNGSYTKHGDVGLIGCTNYYIPIYPSRGISNGTEGESRKPALLLWFFDSRGGILSSGNVPSYVHETVVEWFKVANKRMIETWGAVPGLAFFHQPTEEFKPIHDNIHSHPECPGRHDDILNYQEQNTGLMDALVSAGTIRGVFVGHNHGNSWCCNYKTLALCYNRHTGHGGNWGWPGMIKGSRILELSLDDLWGPPVNFVRLENGTIVDHFFQQV